MENFTINIILHELTHALLNHNADSSPGAEPNFKGTIMYYSASKNFPRIYTNVMTYGRTGWARMVAAKIREGRF